MAACTEREREKERERERERERGDTDRHTDRQGEIIIEVLAWYGGAS